MTRVYIGIGSNLGEREANIAAALEALRGLDGFSLLAVAPAIENPAVDSPPASPDYLNTVCEGDTTLDPTILLECLLEIERRLGRERTGARNAPRTIDLDLLLYGELVLEDSGLVLPHPRMHERDFVLGPLARIAPNACHPALKRTAREMLALLRSTVASHGERQA